jgi:FKBP-type peptidyl-prolyl cis-trans isomerase
MRTSLPVIALTLFIGACSKSEAPVEPAADDAAEGASTFATDNDRILYAIGIAVGSQLAQFEFTEDEIEFVALGFRDASLEKPEQVEMDVFGPQIQNFVENRMRAGQEEALARQAAELATERANSTAFADRIAAEAGAERSVSGLIIVPVTEGTGENPDALDTVTVHYHGTLHDGTVFDSSVERGSPETFPLSGVISCWTEGVQKIRVGGKAKLFCPSDLAYGDDGRPGIPGGAALLFEVELISIE